MKKLLLMLMTLSIMLMININVFAVEFTFPSYEYSNYTDNVGSNSSVSEEFFIGIIDNVAKCNIKGHNYIMNNNRSSYAWSICHVFPDEVVGLLNGDMMYFYYMDGDSLVKYEGDKLLFQYYDTYNGSLTFSLGDYGGSVAVSGVGEWIIKVPYCSSIENLKAYCETGDLSYLVNAKDYANVNVPKPKNVSAYLASEENALYVYYENVNYEPIGEFSTRLWGKQYYRDASGENVEIGEIAQINNEYLKRGQIKISLEDVKDYDTGNISVYLFNRENAFDVEYMSEWIFIDYDIGSNEYTIGSFDYVNGESSDVKAKPITDYKQVNDSYTGGTSNDSSLIKSSDGNYNFLNYVINGFQLGGDNGVISIIGDSLSFIPEPIIYILSGFVAVAVLIALFKILMH